MVRMVLLLERPSHLLERSKISEITDRAADKGVSGFIFRERGAI